MLENVERAIQNISWDYEGQVFILEPLSCSWK
jgi:hypothetical protein